MQPTRSRARPVAVAAALFCVWFTPLLPSLPAHPAAPTRPRMEVVFVLDTTGSMSGMIAGARQHIWTIANQLKSAEPTPEIRFGLVAYRDRGDEYITREFALTTNLDAVYENLHAFVAGGGGDAPESVNAALHAAVTRMQWSTDTEVLRTIFLVGDAPPHRDYPDDIPFAESCRLAARAGILVHTLQCGRLTETESVWREIAARTDGTYAAMPQDGGTVDLSTDCDPEIVRINRALNATIIPYGTLVEQANAMRNRALLEVMSAEGIADRSSFLAKGEYGAVLAGKGDLIAEIIAGRVTVESINPRLLDPRLADLAKAEREALIRQRVAERRALLSELRALLARRDAVVADKLEAAGGGEDVVVLSAFEIMAEDAEAKGYRFNKRRR